MATCQRQHCDWPRWSKRRAVPVPCLRLTFRTTNQDKLRQNRAYPSAPPDNAKGSTGTPRTRHTKTQVREDKPPRAEIAAPRRDCCLHSDLASTTWGDAAATTWIRDAGATTRPRGEPEHKQIPRSMLRPSRRCLLRQRTTCPRTARAATARRLAQTNSISSPWVSCPIQCGCRRTRYNERWQQTRTPRERRRPAPRTPRRRGAGAPEESWTRSSTRVRRPSGDRIY